MSGNRFLRIGAVLAAGALMASCTTAAGQGAAPVATEPAEVIAVPATAPAEPMQAPVPAAFAELPMVDEAGLVTQPVAAAGDRLIVAATPPAGEEPQQFSLWDPRSGATEPLWQGEPGGQDIVTAADGPWVTVVRTGLSLPFEDWELMLRNIDTGEVRTVAKAQSDVASLPGAEPGLPLGFAPFAALHGGHVGWAEYAEADGEALRRIVLYDIASRETTVIAETLAAGGDLHSPSLGGGLLAWLRVSAAGPAADVLDIESGRLERYRLEGQPFQAALTADGRHLAWDDGLEAKFALDLETRALTRYAGAEGWGVTSSGDRFSWAPAAAFGGTGGYFDPAASAVHLLARRDGVVTNYASVLGPWFAWQEAAPDGSTGVYRVARVEPG